MITLYNNHTKIIMWIFTKEPNGKSFEDLIDMAVGLCNEFILVRHKHIDLNKVGEQLLADLNTFLVEVKKQQEWPGTELGHGYAYVYYFKLNDESAMLIKKHFNGLYSWKPSPFEDLCFLRNNRQPWITTISHEQFSWVDFNTVEEFEKILNISGIEIEEIDVQ